MNRTYFHAYSHASYVWEHHPGFGFPPVCESHDISQRILTVRIVAMATAESMDVQCGF